MRYPIRLMFSIGGTVAINLLTPTAASLSMFNVAFASEKTGVCLP